MNETARRPMTARELGLCGSTEHATVYSIVLRDQTAGALGLCGASAVEIDILREKLRNGERGDRVDHATLSALIVAARAGS